jgi:radical SAM superfamily enzyme YgiQ (UPF0313 family)
MAGTLARCSGDVVGLAFNCFNTEEMEILAHTAKDNGALVVCGGHAASSLAKELLTHNRSIDAVVVGDGEQAMLELVRVLESDKNLSRVPNLAYRGNVGIKLNQREEISLEQLQMPRRDVGGLNLKEYIDSYDLSSSDPIQRYIRPTNVVTRRGCPRRAVGRGCSFCARIDRRVRARTPLQAWDEYSYLVNEFGVDYIYEDSDSWIEPNWLSILAEIWEERGGLNTRFRIYGDVRDINGGNVQLLTRLNVDTVLLGIESGDREILLRNGKDFTSDAVVQACDLLGKAGIKVADAYVMGLAGESWESIDKTWRLSEKVRSVCEIAATYWNIMLPLPGSPSWQMLMEASPPAGRFSNTYHLDINAIREEFLTYCTHLGSNALGLLKILRADLCRESSMLVREYIR